LEYIKKIAVCCNYLTYFKSKTLGIGSIINKSGNGSAIYCRASNILLSLSLDGGSGEQAVRRRWKW